MQGRNDICYGLFNDSFPPVMDGVTLTVRNYAEWFFGHGVTPCVVTPRNPAMPHVPYPVLSYFSLPIASRPPYRYGYPRLDFSIRRRLRDMPMAIAHAHSPFSAGRLALHAARSKRIPLIGTFHSKYRSDLEHSLRYAPFMVNYVMRRILSFFRSCDQVWIPQKEVEESVREYGYGGPLQVVENGNDMAALDVEELPRNHAEARRRLGMEQDVPALLFVGQHILEKGVRVILDALLLLRDRGVPFVMNYIGTGYAAEELRHVIRRERLSHCVTLHGVVHDRRLLADYYAASDLFLFPSYYDNAPLVVREAAAMGTPSLIPTGSTAAGVIDHGHNGFLCPRTASDYAEAITRLAADRAALRLAGRGARLSLVRSWDDVMLEVADRYRDLIAYHKRHD